MTHPDDLLADYVDGTLDTDERADVDAHLAGCERCRADVGSAMRARGELRGVPSVDAPPGLPDRILFAAAEPGSQARSGSGDAAWPPLGSLDEARLRRGRPIAKWLAGAAAALVVGLLAFVAIPGLLSEGGSDAAGGSAAAVAPEFGGGPAGTSNSSGGLVLQPGQNYDAASIHQLAAAAASGHAPVPADKATVAGPTEADAATTCLRKGAELKGAEQPVELIEARFEGKPAYLGVYRLPATGGAPDRVEVWVVSRADCSVLSFSQALVR